jgi:hypothetical protein
MFQVALFGTPLVFCDTPRESLKKICRSLSGYTELQSTIMRIIPFVFAFSIIASTVTIAAAQLSAISPSPNWDEAVWYWSNHCDGGKMLGLEVLVDGQEAFSSHLRVCRSSRADYRNTHRNP